MFQYLENAEEQPTCIAILIKKLNYEYQNKKKL